MIRRITTLSASSKGASSKTAILVQAAQQRSFHHENGRMDSSSSSSEALKKTSLYDFHAEHEATFVPFAGYKMPVMYQLSKYKDALKREHLQCRNSAALFDVSHMGQVKVTGADAQEFLEKVTPANIIQLKVGQARLTQFTNENGGILDDLMITKKGESDGNFDFYVVINAACVDSDMAHLQNQLKNLKCDRTGKSFSGSDLQINLISGKSLIALQGPKAVEALLPLLANDEARDRVKNLKFMTSSDEVVVLPGRKSSFSVQVSRCGYTGEDGFEISVPDEAVVDLSRALLQVGGSEPLVRLAGLGCRDTLRLEAGLCLMGHDMTPQITPIEAALNFTIAKRRREEGGFPGAHVIKKQLESGVEKLRVGFSYGQELVGTGKTAVIAREGYKFKDFKTGEEIGYVTSGTLSPILNHPIGMGYIKSEYAKEGTEFGIQIRNNLQVAKITKMPFVPTRYAK
ncbi:hypothetical protein FDP41_008585 [Naegleria fowleri]|uniref:Aminomethyltransferase n=1 Tax=Naegleria fowleri TaxID=5763 RepID=A0A6A5BH66_NAEFO|nr:uncharacterized protein FDP41_008585 [Naegleria fowleri]KAF0973378.1 hypothetical protein FDP41_008585 [Naegleria fowleri]CAG4716448.1 unnamed protein product [Naegleria fowleri]